MNLIQFFQLHPELTQGEIDIAAKAYEAAKEQYDNYADVRLLHAKYGLLLHHTPGLLSARKMQERVDFLHEELKELVEAANEGDIYKQADALVDLVYVALGTAAMMGLPWNMLWKEVQRANMEKVRGVSHRGHPVDLIKPPGWKPPNHQGIINSIHKTNPEEPPRDDIMQPDNL